MLMVTIPSSSVLLVHFRCTGLVLFITDIPGGSTGAGPEKPLEMKVLLIYPACLSLL